MAAVHLLCLEKIEGLSGPETETALLVTAEHQHQKQQQQLFDPLQATEKKQRRETTL